MIPFLEITNYLLKCKHATTKRMILHSKENVIYSTYHTISSDTLASKSQTSLLKSSVPVFDVPCHWFTLEAFTLLFAKVTKVLGNNPKMLVYEMYSSTHAVSQFLHLFKINNYPFIVCVAMTCESFTRNLHECRTTFTNFISLRSDFPYLLIPKAQNSKETLYNHIVFRDVVKLLHTNILHMLLNQEPISITNFHRMSN